jgi:hypothetical protein
MGACFHIDSVRCPNCTPQDSAIYGPPFIQRVAQSASSMAIDDNVRLLAQIGKLTTERDELARELRGLTNDYSEMRAQRDAAQARVRGWADSWTEEARKHAGIKVALQDACELLEAWGGAASRLGNATSAFLDKHKESTPTQPLSPSSTAGENPAGGSQQCTCEHTLTEHIDGSSYLPCDKCIGDIYERPNPPAPPKLSAEARATRAPRPPEELVGALHDNIHPTSGRLISASPVFGKFAHIDTSSEAFVAQKESRLAARVAELEEVLRFIAGCTTCDACALDAHAALEGKAGGGEL